MSIRTRFAPSPTGYLHIGGVRTALYNWILAKQGGGQFILRIDDTDTQRNVEAALLPILDGLRWLGLQWDEGPSADGRASHGPYGPYFQSQRQTRYQEAVERLLESGHAYRDYARPEELQQLRTEAEKAGRTFVYDRRWMAADDAQAAAFEAEGRRPVVRLKMPREGKCVFDDLIHGRVEFDWASEQDHVIQRADGSCLYHLASVVDDADMKITHVVRGVEHLSNTPRQIFIAQSLGFPVPQYAHLPYVAEPGGSAKLSKRKLNKYLKNKDFADLYEIGTRIARRIGIPHDAETFNPVLIGFYRDIGFLPDAILNYLLLLGWALDDRREDFTRDDMIELFTLSRINKAPASFDPQKLMAFQARWMDRLPLAEKTTICVDFLTRAGLLSRLPTAEDLKRVERVVEAAGERLKIGGAILDFDFMFVPDDQLEYDEQAFHKRLCKPDEAIPLLQDFAEELAALEPFDAEHIEQCLKQFVSARGIKIGQIIHALRVATTGRAVGFGMFETLEILGKSSSLARIRRAIERARQGTA